jgi:PEGA domain-containing protein
MRVHQRNLRVQLFGGRFCCALAVFAVLSLAGCVQRRLTIRSNPPGARVYVGDEEIGTTPVSTDFVYYGTRKIRLVKDGYETMVVNQPIPAPWYQIPPLDFVSENIVPGEVRDERVVNYQLVPLQPVPTDQLLSRAEQLRSASGARPVSFVTPTIPGVPANVAPPGARAPAAIPVQPLPEPVQGGPVVNPPPYNPPPYNPPQYLPPG